MRYAILENNEVVNVIKATPEFITESGMNAIQSDFADIGDIYQDGQFITPEPEPQPIEFKPVKPLYFRLALLQVGMLETIETNLTGAAKLAFEYALQFERYDPMILEMAQAFNVSEEQLDQIFLLGMQLQG